VFITLKMASTEPSTTAAPASRAKVIFAPHRSDFVGKSVFLAGSIDMGTAVDWQAAITSSLSDLAITIVNPRRPDWTNDWVQDITCPPFKEQVDWELDMQESVDVIALYFSPESKAPISLLELGLFARSGRMVVDCPEGFWRRGNVQIVCDRFGIKLCGSLEELTEVVRGKLSG
jgi:hypothetical protein